MNLNLTQIRAWIGVDATGDAAPAATGYSIDSRTVSPGDLFFAIKGPNFDGHEFVDDALRAGAVAAVVAVGYRPGEETGLMRVVDPAVALAQLAHAARRAWDGSVVAITGSNGKTTSKEITAAILGEALAVSKTAGNLNNELGLPLSILRIGDGDRVAVLEMGMNHAGEIRRLAEIAAPNIGVVTNVSVAHVGHFDSIGGIAAAKRELIESLDSDGTAVLNADDERVAAFGTAHAGRTITFGIDNAADLRAEHVVDLGTDGVRFSVEGDEFETSLAGRHNVYNVVAALAVARTFGIELSSLVEAVRRLTHVGMRGEVRRVGGVTVIDDCYNANPAAMKAMLDVLENTPARRRVAVLGEMRELGARSVALHQEIGAAVSAAGIDHLIAVGGDAVQMASAAGGSAEFYETPEAAGLRLAEYLSPGDAVLVKGSRGVALERARDMAYRSLETADVLVEEVS